MIQLFMSSKRKYDLNIDKLVMIGRQNLHLNSVQLQQCLDLFGFIADAKHILEENNTFADGLFRTMGSKEVASVDASDYEDATIIHDMNHPINQKHKNTFDIVLDSGTLEHVFNFPIAMQNCMELVNEKGYFIGIYPCNNFFGHGFYQFSSELFYRTLSTENGFEIKDVVIFVDEPDTSFYSVPDTSEQYSRIQYTNSKPVYIYVLAQKIKETKIFANPPQQMDYAAMKWKGNRPKAKKSTKKKTLKNHTPKYIKNIIKALFNKIEYDDRFNFKKPFFKRYQL